MVINPIVGVYIPIIRIPIKGWMTIPNTRSLDPGSHGSQTEASKRSSSIDTYFDLHSDHQNDHEK